jgi:hypothetical protein
MARVVVWFSCGAASAVAAKLALERFSPTHEVVVAYCDTSADEHDDNARFLADVELWLGIKIQVLRSEEFRSVDDVFAKRRYMAGIKGAPCTVALKKVPRFRFQRADDIHVFGFTADEGKRIAEFESRNPELTCAWVLRDAGVTKQSCYWELVRAKIDLPAMYRLGYRNNNCKGCVKATSPAYWAKVRRDFPEVFADRARRSRELGARLVRLRGRRIFLDELPDGDFSRSRIIEDISCGPECAPNQHERTE